MLLHKKEIGCILAIEPSGQNVPFKKVLNQVQFLSNVRFKTFCLEMLLHIRCPKVSQVTTV